MTNGTSLTTADKGNWLLALFRYIEAAQREGLSQTTAYGAYRKAGGLAPAVRFRTLWRLAANNPFRWRGLE